MHSSLKILLAAAAVAWVVEAGPGRQLFQGPPFCCLAHAQCSLVQAQGVSATAGSASTRVLHAGGVSAGSAATALAMAHQPTHMHAPIIASLHVGNMHVACHLSLDPHALPPTTLTHLVPATPWCGRLKVRPSTHTTPAQMHTVLWVLSPAAEPARQSIKPGACKPNTHLYATKILRLLFLCSCISAASGNRNWTCVSGKPTFFGTVCKITGAKTGVCFYVGVR